MRRKKLVKSIKGFNYLVKSFLKYGKKYFVLLLIFSLVSPILLYIDTTVLQVSLNAVQEQYPFYKSVLVLGIYLLIALTVHLISELFVRFSVKEKIKIQKNMNTEVYIKARNTDMCFLDNPQYYDAYLWSIRGFYQNSLSAITLLSRGISIFLNIFVVVSLIISTEPIIVLFSIINVFVTVVLNTVSNRINYKKKLELIHNDKKDSYISRSFYLNDYAQEMRITGLCRHLLKYYDDSSLERINVVKKYQNKNLLLNFVNKSFNFSVFITIILFLIYQSKNNSLSYGDFALLITASQNLITELTDMTSFIPSIVELGLNSQKIMEFNEIPSKIENNNTEYYITEHPCSLEFKNVSFKYPNCDDFVLKNLNLVINGGEKVAIVGKNGAGKSTFAKLLLRLYDSTEGVILINNRDIKDIDTTDLRKKIGNVPQNNHIFALTLKENFELDGTDRNESSYVEVLNALDLAKYIDKLENNATKEFDDNGLMFSGGEIQKIGIARASMSEFAAIILDEPTSSLDPVSESKLIDFISNKFQNVTTVMIAHRLSTIRHFDKICVFDNGEIVEIGTHNTLMKEKGIYYEMFTSQSENYLP